MSFSIFQTNCTFQIFGFWKFYLSIDHFRNAHLLGDFRIKSIRIIVLSEWFYSHDLDAIQLFKEFNLLSILRVVGRF